MAVHRHSGEALAAIAQIEDAEALDQLDAIAAVPGLDALFIGRADLTISLDADGADDARVVEAVQRIVSAGRRAGIATGMFLPRVADVGHWRDAGATLFLLESDHHFLRAGSTALAGAIRG
jgi:2-keto-3-deoxy-L-rhamnonate aldolase RhmA